MRIVHVTETLVAGVLAAVAALATKQAQLGQEVTVVYSRKPTVPPPGELDERFPPEVRRVEVPFRSRPSSIWDLGRAVRGLTTNSVDVLHLHSTFAGLAGRLAPGIRGKVSTIVYSPHGWAFLRGEASAVSSRAALTIERALARQCDGLILVSESEAELTRARIRGVPSCVLVNGIPVDNLPLGAGSSEVRPVVVASGRIMEQKAPDRFADVARVLAGRARFVWVGDGSEEERVRWLGDAPVQVTGWLPHHEVVQQLASADVFLFPTRWEGMPIALMEAQAIGVPSVATDIVGNRDVIVHGETGVLCTDTDELVAAVAKLVDDVEARGRMRQAALQLQRQRLSDASLGQRSLAVYAQLAQPAVK